MKQSAIASWTIIWETLQTEEITLIEQQFFLPMLQTFFEQNEKKTRFQGREEEWGGGRKRGEKNADWGGWTG